MKKELEYFMIDGEFGGNQDWFTNIVMNVGGCGAATACDSCIYLAKYKGMKKLYPFDLEQMDKEAYKKFSQIMKPYIRPRVQGVKKPEWYIEGLAKYISDVNENMERIIRLIWKNSTGQVLRKRQRRSYANRLIRDFRYHI